MYRNGVYCFPLPALLPLLAMLPVGSLKSSGLPHVSEGK